MTAPILTRRHALLAGLAAATASGDAAAQTPAWPTQTVKFIVPFPPGSATDTYARLVGEAMQKLWGQPVVVDNKPGANSIIGTEAAARSKPDGHTILFGSGTGMASNVALFKKLPYDPEKDFQAVLRFGASPSVLIVHPDVPAKTVAELVAWAKANPAKASYAAGTTPSRIAGAYLNHLAGTNLQYVAYKSTPLAVQDVVAGHVPIGFADPQVMLPFKQTNKLRALAVTAPKRYFSLADVPTFGEQGVNGFDLLVWVAVYTPAGVPAPIHAKIARDMLAFLRQPEIVAKFVAMGVEPDYLGPEEHARFQTQEIAFWKRLVPIAGIEPE
jgi:tripartite-type tricarboxylate transporter receptor subunit TctC